MPLLRLSRLYQDTAKNLCAGASPVARVPATPSGAYDLLFSGVSAFGRPARFVRPGRSCGMSRGAPSGRKPDPTFSVGKTRGALSPPQQPIKAGQGAHLSSRRFSSRITAHTSRVTGRRMHASPCSPQPPGFRLLNFQLLTVNYHGLSTPDRPAPIFQPKSFTIRTYAKMCLQVLWNLHLQMIGLKAHWNQHIQKTPGGRGPALVANAGLKDGFCGAALHL